ncbi:MAG: hypothetical protein O3C43_17215 [Verrucomicrobia bacterium]|nr:hypothetical protein [Verrucomicrobiota bacterium]
MTIARREFLIQSGKVSIGILIEGSPHVPVSLEMSFRSGGKLKGVTADKNLDGAYFLESGMGQYAQGGDVITFCRGDCRAQVGRYKRNVTQAKWRECLFNRFYPFQAYPAFGIKVPSP